MRLFARCAAILLLFVLAISAQILVVTIAEITCDSAAHAFFTSGVARWVQLSAPSGNSAIVRYGDSNVSATRGSILASGTTYLAFPPTGQAIGYDMTKLYYYCTASDKLEITWAK